MGVDGLVRLGTLDQSERPKARFDRRSDRFAPPHHAYPANKLPLRTRALIIIGLAVLAWLPVIAIGCAMYVWI
jgi:hypothetical protein